MAEMYRARVYQILLYPERDKPGRALKRVIVDKNLGLPGDYHQEDVTFVEWENIAPLCKQFGVVPTDLRRQIVTKCVDLNALVGKRFWVGTALFEGIEKAEPCRWLQEQVGKPVLAVLVDKGGIRAKVIRGGAFYMADDIVPEN